MNPFPTRHHNDLPEGLLRVARLENFVITPLEVEPQHWDSPLIDHIRINLTVAVLIGDHFAAAGKLHKRAVRFADTALQFHSVATAENLLRPVSESRRRHAAAASKFDVAAPR